MTQYKFPFSGAKTINKYGVDISIYNLANPNVNMVYEEVVEGHFEEFLNTKSTIVWFIFDGEGTFVINDEKIPVVAKDVVVVPPNNRIHYFGNMKMTLTTVPPFNANDEKHIRDVKKEESPYFKG
jgi:cupin superfamily acireductone dioxygenase involved in methionine salvage